MVVENAHRELREAASTSTWKPLSVRSAKPTNGSSPAAFSSEPQLSASSVSRFFLRGVWLLRKAQRDGLSVRPPLLVTLIGYLVIIDAAINTVGWALDLVASHTLLARVLLNGWGGNMFDAGGYFWHYNELWLGGAAGPGEKAMEVGMILTVFTMRIAAAIGFLQMKRWGGHQWMIITCWMGILIWCLYVFNMTMYADVRFAGVVLPRRRMVALRHLLHHPFLAIPYLHSVNREIFSD